MLYVVLRPDKTPLSEPFLDMGEAQRAIEHLESDTKVRETYQIHPISGPADAEALKIKVIETWTLEKFDGEYVGQAPVEVVECNS